MAWDKQYYKAVREFVKYGLEHLPIQLRDRIKCPVEWARTYLPLITMSLQKEDYEAAKATKDAITAFLRTFGIKIHRNDTLKIPATYTKPKGGVHISWGDPDDPSGLASGNPPDGIPNVFVYDADLTKPIDSSKYDEGDEEDGDGDIDILMSTGK